MGATDVVEGDDVEVARLEDGKQRRFKARFLGEAVVGRWLAEGSSKKLGVGWEVGVPWRGLTLGGNNGHKS